MIITVLDDIKSELTKHFKARRLLPVVGAGFTCGCNAKSGKTPSGDELRTYMLQSIEQIGHSISTIKMEELKKIAYYYKRLANEVQRKRYLIDNFTQISIPEYQIDFLKIDWLYIYTLNIDTAIEDNSKYKRVILPNRRVDSNFTTVEDYVLKLHGDVRDYTEYKDSKSYIFDYDEYIKSLNENEYLLNKISNDFRYSNLIFVGCSLKDEIDLFASFNKPDLANTVTTSKYYITDVKSPDIYMQMDLEAFGITHIVAVENYKKFYEEFYNIYLDSQKVQVDELAEFKNVKVSTVSGAYNENIEYLIFGKSLYNMKSKDFALPDFFVRRNIVNDIVDEMSRFCIQFICGGHVSGKTYCLSAIKASIKNRDNYFFGSRVSLNQKTINTLLNSNNDVILLDTSSVSKDQISDLLYSADKIKSRNINIIVCINKSDKDIIASIKYMWNPDLVKIYDLPNKFNEEEIKNVNFKLSRMGIYNFEVGATILDNIIKVSKDTQLNKKSNEIKLSVTNKYEMIVLILLAIKEKLYSKDFVDFNIEREVFDMYKKITPVIDEDYTYMFEKSEANSSNYKLYLNSKYWVLNKLGELSSDLSKHNVIVEAYKSIVSSLIHNYGLRYKNIEDYIKYDIINEIFFKEERGNLRLIKNIYDGLNDLLADNPHFHHQKAKCYLWHSRYSDNIVAELNLASRFASVARHNLRLEDPEEKNKSINISVAHIDCTIALIITKQNSLLKYQDVKLFKEGIEKIVLALRNNYNKEYLDNLIKRRDNKVNDILDFLKYAQLNDLEYLHLKPTEKRDLNSIINDFYDKIKL